MSLAGNSNCRRSNGVPDECDINGGTSQDCNINGVPDECDISSGTSRDCNGNGIPDECEFGVPTGVEANPPAVCSGDPATLSAMPGSRGDAVEWLMGSCDGVVIDTGTSITVNPIGTTTYYARTKDTASGCTSDCVSVTETVLDVVVLGRNVFYNHSAWDGLDPAPNGNDDLAVATDKQALTAGQTATFANYISYNKGLTGIMIDVQCLPHVPLLGTDIFFLLGNSDGPMNWWTLAPDPTSITVRPGAGVGGSYRITLIWPNQGAPGAIPNSTWLLVLLFSDSNGGTLGLATDDFFCFGLAIGEGSGDGMVSPTDEIGARLNPHTPLNRAWIDDPWDFNRDRLVTPTDQIIARTHTTTPFDKLRLIVWP